MNSNLISLLSLNQYVLRIKAFLVKLRAAECRVVNKKKEMDGSCDEMTNGEGERGKYRDVRV